jgi:hypothetical protein
MQNAATHGRQQWQHALEGSAFAAGEDRYVAGRGTMTAARHRAIDRLGAGGPDLLAQAQYFILIGSAHFGPDFSGHEARENAVLGLHHRRARRGTGQTGNYHIDILRHFARAIGPLCAAIEKRLRDIGIEVSDR